MAEGALNQTRGFQLALEHYMKDCAQKETLCPTGPGGKQGNRILIDWLTKIDKKPLPTTQGRPVTADTAQTAIASALYSQDAWKYLTQGLRQAMSGERADILRALADLYVGRDQKGRYSNLQAANHAVSCADTSERVSKAKTASLRAKFLEASPVFGRDATYTGCNGWPVRGTSRTLDVSARGAEPILVIGQTGDPATPVAGAGRLARALGDGVGIDISVDGEGHGAYGSGNTCLNELVDDYLLRDVVPRRGAHCS
jgi:hypothetical protein